LEVAAVLVQPTGWLTHLNFDAYHHRLAFTLEAAA
jgi:hypothetical protein